MKNQIIEILKERSDYISGEYLSEILNVSRTTIWKYINILKDEGYEIESSTNKGYKLVKSADILTLNEIKDYLNTGIMGKDIKYYETIESTNKEAKEIVYDSLEGTVIIGEEQTIGRGRMGRNWISPKYKGIWMTIILKPEIDPSKAGQITLIASAAIIKALDKMGVYAQIKWPNDILINRKKVAGILTEMNCELNLVNYILLGIGVNVNLDRNDFTDDLKDKASSIKIEENRSINRKELLGNILNEFEKLYIDFLNSGNILKSIHINRKNLVSLNENVRILRNDENVLARVKNLNDKGELVVEYLDGSIENIFSGEVSIRGLNGYI